MGICVFGDPFVYLGIYIYISISFTIHGYPSEIVY